MGNVGNLLENLEYLASPDETVLNVKCAKAEVEVDSKVIGLSHYGIDF